jgi:DNA-binding IclR family transcriptional regulator
MGDAVVVIARTGGPGAFQLADRVGVVRPAHCTALGKIILASLSDDQFKRFLDRVELTPSTAKSITDAATLRREVADVRHSGVAYDEGEFNLEVRCIAVPVRDFTGQNAGALGISGPIWRQTGRGQPAKVKALQAAASRLSAAFGTR